MKFKTLLSLLIWQAISATGAMAEVTVGSMGPKFEITSIDGASSFSSASEKGKVLLVNFWATWCAPCKAEMPVIDHYYKKHKAEGLEVIAISMDASKDLEKVKTYARQFSFPIALKGSANIKEFGRIWRLPSTFIVDRHGVLVKNGHEGDPEVTLELLESLVSPLLKQ